MRVHLPRRILSLLLLFLANPAFAGAWLQAKGESLLIGQASISRSDTVVQSNGDRISQPGYKQFVASLYGETGLTDWLTIGVAANGTDAWQSGNHASALTEPTLFARLPLWESGTRHLSIEPVVQLPRTLQSSDGIRVGNPRSEYELALDYGESRTVLGWDSFADLRAGYRFRAGGPGDQWRVQGALGTHPAPRWMGLLQAFGTFRSSSSSAFTQSGADDYDQVRLQASAVWELTPAWSLQAGAFTDAYGRNFGLADGALIGVWRRF